ncbi:MAG: vWA domain-containing protein [Planctomycetota bacterium]
MLNFHMIAEGEVLKWLAGQNAATEGTPKLQWAGMPESWGVFVLIAIVAAIGFAVFWLYRRELNTAPMPVKLLMAALRFAVLLLLIVLFLKPSVFYQQINEIKPMITVLRDASLSFARGDTYRDDATAQQLAESTGLPVGQIQSGQVDRSTLLVEAINNDEGLIASLRDKGSLQIYDFSTGREYIGLIPATARQDTQPQETAAGNDDSVADGADEEAADEDQTLMESFPTILSGGSGPDVWQALRETLDDPERVSAIILASDFQHNGSENPVELAKKAASLGIPIYAIGIGDPNPPRNVLVDDVYVREKAYPDEPFEIEATLQTTRRGETGLPEEITVELVQYLVDPASNSIDDGEVIESRDNVVVPENGGRIHLDFGHVVIRPGTYRYAVRTPALEGEVETDDNTGWSSDLEVVDDKVQVLLVSGQPSWDYQQVQRLLERDQTIELSCWLQSQDNTMPQRGNLPISRLPRVLSPGTAVETITEQYLAYYDIIILFDPDPTKDFNAEWMDQLQDFCRNNAGGLMFVAGPQHSAEFLTLNSLSTMRDLLPVRFGDTDFIRSSQALADANNPGAVRLMPVEHNMDHPVMAFKSDPGESRKIWAMMPGVYWSFPTRDPRPTARVLIEIPDVNRNDAKNQPLLVTGRYGAGTVMYMGFQGTWRWRPLGVQAQYFDRFWIQAVRFLIETRSLQGERRGFIDVDQTEYEIGDDITFVGRVLDPEFQPSTAETFEVKLSTGGRVDTLEMKLLPDREGQYEGIMKASRIGDYQATIELSSDSGQQAKLIDPVSFRVVPPRVESSAFWLNEQLMNEIASRSGGQAFRLDQLGELARTIPRKITTAEFNSPPQPLWDLSQLMRFIAFSLPVVLLTAEWALRKYYKLM